MIGEKIRAESPGMIIKAPVPMPEMPLSIAAVGNKSGKVIKPVASQRLFTQQTKRQESAISFYFFSRVVIINYYTSIYVYP